MLTMADNFPNLHEELKKQLSEENLSGVHLASRQYRRMLNRVRESVDLPPVDDSSNFVGIHIETEDALGRRNGGAV